MAAAIVTVAMTASEAAAQDPQLGVQPNLPESTVPVIGDGRSTAAKLCIGCHVIDNASNGIPAADVPSFASIADRPVQSVDALSIWLTAPHLPMPDPHLTRKEIRDLAGYIFSLRRAP
ncbi:hypothetical protein GIW81_00125 [Hyphomicrobium sp. xq]|uniref:Cytochrome c domain-containing protein n=1 Tax=Hyphomicrobium album TaxID=2665159 RepID=A0A6I3KEH9_9HYPH|nr:hypothetical protein [Hyphomicrobium album]